MYQKIILDKSAQKVAANFIKSTEPNLVPENIKKDVDILGVIGTYGGDTPVPPTELTPFEVDQYVSGMNVNVEGDATALDSFLANYVDPQGGILSLGITTEDEDLIIGACKAFGGSDPMWNDWVLMIQVQNEESVAIMYSTQAQDINNEGQTIGTIPAGWSKIVDFQDIAFESISTNQQITFDVVQKVTTCNADFDSINGTYVGAIEGEPPTPIELTPFEDNDEIGPRSLIANVNMSTSDIADIVSKIADNTALITGNYKGTDFPIVEVGTDDQYGKGLVVGDSILFLCEKLSDLDAGWQYDSETTPVDSQTGVVDLSQVIPSGVLITVYADGGWNGVILGKNTSPTPPTGLTQIENDTTFSQVTIDPNAVPDGYSSLNDYLDSLTYSGAENSYVLLNTHDVQNPSSYESNIVAYDLGTAKMVSIGTIQTSAVYFSGPFQEYGVDEAGWYHASSGGGLGAKITETTQVALKNLDTSLYIFIEEGDISADFAPLNGVVIGAYDPQPYTPPTPSLTSFTTDDTIESGDKICFDTSISDADLTSFCSGLTYDDGICNLVANEDQSSGYIVVANVDGTYAIMVANGTDAPTGWASAAIPDMGIQDAGWFGLDQDGKVTLVSNVGAVGYINPAEGWNGVIVGFEKNL